MELLKVNWLDRMHCKTTRDFVQTLHKCTILAFPVQVLQPVQTFLKSVKMFALFVTVLAVRVQNKDARVLYKPIYVNL